MPDPDPTEQECERNVLRCTTGMCVGYCKNLHIKNDSDVPQLSRNMWVSCCGKPHIVYNIKRD